MSKNTEKNIYSIARNLFLQFGPKSISIDKIVEQVGIGKGTFYNYFSSKEELYEKIITDTFEENMQFIDLMIQKYKDPKKRIFYSLLVMIDFYGAQDCIHEKLIDDKEYYFGNINADFFDSWYRKLTKNILSLDKENSIVTNEENIQFIMEIFFHYKSVLKKTKHIYKSQKEFQNTMTRFAYFLSEGMFQENFAKIATLQYDTFEQDLQIIGNNSPKNIGIDTKNNNI